MSEQHVDFAQLQSFQASRVLTSDSDLTTEIHGGLMIALVSCLGLPNPNVSPIF